MNEPLPDDMHLAMLARARRERSFWRRLKRAWQAFSRDSDIYGLKWGDPENCPPLRYVRDTFLLPHVSDESTIVEIGPGGGRWTRYMLKARRIYAVDAYAELLDELRRRFDRPNIVHVHNNGTDFPGVPERSVDFVFSFGVFVHLERAVIEEYLRNIRRIMKPDGVIVLQYSDKRKPMARMNPGFTDNDPQRMREMALRCGYRILEEDTMTLWHSAIIKLAPPPDDQGQEGASFSSASDAL